MLRQTRVQILNTNGTNDTNDTNMAAISPYIREIRLFVSFVIKSASRNGCADALHSRMVANKVFSLPGFLIAVATIASNIADRAAGP